MIYNSGVSEMIENIQYKFSENQELAMMANSFLETYVNAADQTQQEFDSNVITNFNI